MKIFVIRILQRILGYERYLYFFSRFIITTLAWNKREKDFLHFISLLPEKGAILDVGANIGVMTTHLAKKRKLAHIFAFEPVPSNIRTLQKIVRHFGFSNVYIIQTALGNTIGEASMILPCEKKALRQGLSHIEDASQPGTNGEHFTVKMQTLDSLPELNGEHTITGIKLDVENYEYYVLDGAQELIQKHRPLIYAELWHNENREKCVRMLEEMGYRASVLRKNELIPYSGQGHSAQNFFFIHERPLKPAGHA